MATLQDLSASAVINIFSAFAFLLAFALLRIQPVNDRVYFPKWYIKGTRKSPATSGVGRFVNLNFMTYVKFLNWMPDAIKMSEKEIVEHAGVDSTAFLRIFLFGLKLFVPMTVLAIVVLVPINLYSKSLTSLQKDLTYSDIDKLSISNVKSGSQRFWFHLLMAYTFTLWTFYLLFHEYKGIASMRLNFLASRNRCADQFTVIVTNVPCVSGVLMSENVERFFRTNHPNRYLCHQLVYDANRLIELENEKKSVQNWLDFYELKYERHPEARPTCKTSCFGFCGRRVDSIDFYRRKIEELQRKHGLQISDYDRASKVVKDPNAVMPVAFVSFNSRWAAAVCAQTQQSKNPILWLTDWAPEPRDIYWQNLAIPFVSLNIRRLIIFVSVFALVFFYMIPIAFVQSLANLEGLERVAPFLRPLIQLKAVKSFIQGYLPGLILNLFLLFLPTILMSMSRVEGHISLSKLERESAAKYYYFMLVNVFLGSIITGTAFQQLHSFIHQSPTEIPQTIGVSIPMKATFFMTYIMVDGWAGVAGEILRLKPLVIYHLKNMFLVKTEKDLEQAMEPGSIGIPENLPKLQLYFLLGLVYAVVSPILLPFIVIFFCFGYLVYRHQVINVYIQQYESVAAFWPYFHGRIIAGLIISQFLLMGLLSTKRAASSTPLLTALPLLTFWFHKYCKRRFEPAFRNYPLEEAMCRDMMEMSTERNLNLKPFLVDAYLHPIFQTVGDLEMGGSKESGSKNGIFETSPMISELSSPSPQFVFHHEIRSSHSKTGSVKH